MDRRLAGLSALLSFAFLTAEAPADWPPPYTLTEMQPPTASDWIQLRLKREARARARCGLPPRKPVMIPGDTIYFPCPECREPGRPPHMSFQGTYGYFYPTPYYIPAQPKWLLIDPLCPTCRSPHSPTYRYDVTSNSKTLEESSEVRPAFAQTAAKLAVSTTIDRHDSDAPADADD
ncbi:hypothetical protein Pan216_26670 [Planctomycetes bacterium Pan216]|uniref:Uncharacterized protein n=1 Tax=Kolteria novifilia TaxID=2527975 RepID=A0A518B4D7_9BACT|nr:hypothetical protein Pan216_26670 [Planctomycetes bacterium Pan216]